MQLRRLLTIVTIVFSASAQACGSSVEVGPAGSGDAAGGDPSGGAGAGGVTPGGGETEAFCAEAGAKTAEGSCYQGAACSMYCNANAGAWPDEVDAAFAVCAQTNPLCYMSVEGCLLEELHPNGSPRHIRVAGKGFDAYDGKVLRVWHDPESGAAFGGETVIAGGVFVFEWVEPVSTFDTGGPLLLLFIDMDGDKACSADADLTASASTEWNGDYIDPIYAIELSPPLKDPAFVCDYAP